MTAPFARSPGARIAMTARHPARRAGAECGRLALLGDWSEARYEAQLDRFRAALAREGLTAAGEPTWARCDPPWTPWYLRTDEIWLELAPDPRVATRLPRGPPRAAPPGRGPRRAATNPR